jgi:hypothetical protein
VRNEPRTKCGTSLPIPIPIPFADAPPALESSEKNLERTERQKATSKPTPPKEKKPRKPLPTDPLFDVILEVTGKDQKASYIVKVAGSLLERNFTPEDVRKFSGCWRERLAWAIKDKHPRLTPGIIDNHIHVLRELPSSPTAPIRKDPKDNPDLFLNRK